MCCQGIAAEFSTYWSLSRVLEGSPDRTPLQGSRRDEGLSHRFREGGPESGGVFEMVKKLIDGKIVRNQSITTSVT